MLTIAKWQDAERLPTPFSAVKLLSIPQAELVRFSLKPFEKIQPHKNEVDAVFHIVEGAGILTVDEEDYLLETNDSVFVAKDAHRGIRTADNVAKVEVLVVKLR